MDDAMEGSIYYRSFEIEKELVASATKPFKKLIRVHIGDSQSIGRKPMTFVRQVLALVSYPELINSTTMPSDAIAKAQRILKECGGGSIGSYSDGDGIELIKKHVADFISRRDGGIESKPEDIVLTEGVSDGICIIMKYLQHECNELDTGLLAPIPLYPFYSAVLNKYSIRQINYYLDETNGWELKISELERAYDEALCKCNCTPRAILVVNPFNPTGKILNREKMESIVKFAYEKNLVILADEIYQDNIHVKDAKLLTFKKVIMEMPTPYNSKELVSFNSISKGFIGECGLRGGYFEFINSDPRVKKVLHHLVSVRQCPNLIGQVALDCLVDPPKEGDPSYQLFENEKGEMLKNLREIGLKLTQELNKLEGFDCPTIEGGLVAFTKVVESTEKNSNDSSYVVSITSLLTLPSKAIEAAKASKKYPDEFYGLELLESAGIVVTIGSAFGLPANKTYLRITVPATLEKLNAFLEVLTKFHVEFMKRYS